MGTDENRENTNAAATNDGALDFTTAPCVLPLDIPLEQVPDAADCGMREDSLQPYDLIGHGGMQQTSNTRNCDLASCPASTEPDFEGRVNGILPAVLDVVAEVILDTPQYLPAIPLPRTSDFDPALPECDGSLYKAIPEFGVDRGKLLHGKHLRVMTYSSSDRTVGLRWPIRRLGTVTETGAGRHVRRYKDLRAEPEPDPLPRVAATSNRRTHRTRSRGNAAQGC